MRDKQRPLGRRKQDAATLDAIAHEVAKEARVFRALGWNASASYAERLARRLTKRAKSAARRTAA